jgi:hypothetical protein
MATFNPYYNAGGSSAIPVVQGQYVSTPGYQPQQQQQPQTSYYSANDAAQEGQWTHGEKQPTACKDFIWAILFYAHLGVIAFVTAFFVPQMAQDIASGYSGRRLIGGVNRLLSIRSLEEAEEADIEFDLNAIFIILSVAGLAGLIISTGALCLMMMFPSHLIKLSLFLNLIFTGAMFIAALISGAIQLAVMTVIMFVVNAWYTYAVWSRIPWAGANLKTAIHAIRDNHGLAFFAYGNLFLSFLWTLWWSIAIGGTTYVLSDCDAEGVCEGEMNGFVMFLFLVSFYWVAQVIKNVLAVTVSGTVATWWLFPNEARGCCSQAVRESYWRSVTTSFGSICLGSLIVALIQATRELLNSLRNDDNSLLLCLVDCFLSCLESLAEYFNKVRHERNWQSTS